MNQYITETEYAVKNLIELTSKGNIKLEEIKATLYIAAAKFKHLK